MPRAITCRCGCQEWYLIEDNGDETPEIRCAACGKRFLGDVSAEPITPDPRKLGVPLEDWLVEREQGITALRVVSQIRPRSKR
jgi:hypothetical protein